MKKGTIEITLKLRGTPAGVVHALANGLPLDALLGIRDGMDQEMAARRAAAREKRPRRVVAAIPGRRPRK